MRAGNLVMLRMCSEPVEVGYKPEMSVVRAGAQTGAFDQAFRYRSPRAAKRSRFGVVEYRSPYAPRCGPMSSQVSQRTLGGCDLESTAASARTSKNPITTKEPTTS